MNVTRHLIPVSILRMILGVTVALLLLHSCSKKDHYLETDLVQEQDLMAAAKSYYYNHLGMTRADLEVSTLSLANLRPNWNNAQYVVNSEGEKIIGVPLSSSSTEYNELNVLIRDDIPVGLIKSYKRLNDTVSLLTFSSANGKELEQGFYNIKRRSYNPNSSFRIQSIMGNSPLFTTMEEDVEGGELEEVEVYPPGGGGGGGTPPIIVPPPPIGGGGGDGGGSGGTGSGSTAPPSERNPNLTNSNDPDRYEWAHPVLSLPPQTLPSWATILSNFKNLAGAAMFAEVGGVVRQYQLGDPATRSNSCALRISSALNYSGKLIPQTVYTMKGADNLNYILSAAKLKNYMLAVFGQPTKKLTYPTPAEAQSALSGKKGIYIMKAAYPEQFGASGHATLYNGSTCPDACFFNAAGGVHEIYFWELN